MKKAHKNKANANKLYLHSIDTYALSDLIRSQSINLSLTLDQKI